MLQSEQADPALRLALQRKHSSTTGQVVSRPYEQAKAAVRAGEAANAALPIHGVAQSGQPVVISAYANVR